MSTYVDIRATYVAQTYLPLIHNFSPYAEQQPNIGSPRDQYRFIALTVGVRGAVGRSGGFFGGGGVALRGVGEELGLRMFLR